MADEHKKSDHKPADKHTEHKPGEHKGEHKAEHKGAEHKPAHKPGEHKTEHKGEHKSGEHKPEHKAAEHKPAHKPAEHKAEHKPAASKPAGKSDKATGTHKKTEAAEKRTEGKQPAKTTPRGQKPGKKDDVKIVEKPTEKKHVARSKANLTEDQRKALALRDNISGRRPWFRRTQWYEYKRLSNTGWRRPRGVDSAMRRHFGYEQPVVAIGFGGPKSVRGLHSSGFQEVYVEVLEDLKKIDTKTQAARVSGNLGARKLRMIYAEADKLGVRVLNRRDLPPAPKSGGPRAAATATTTKPATTTKGGQTQ